MVAAARSSDPSRLAVQLEEWFARDGVELERVLSPTFWRAPCKGDLAEAFNLLSPAAGPLTAFARRATLEGLWAFLRADPTPAGLRAYFRWFCPERARRLAQVAATGQRAASAPVRRGGEVPGGLARLRGGEALLRTYVADVRMEFRRQQASFDTWAHATGLLQLASGHPDHGGDPLLGWKPGFRAAAVLRDQRAVANAAGQHALDTLWAAAARRRRAAGLSGVPDFSLDDPDLQAQIDQLLLDQVGGIDDTTAAGIRQILSNGVGQSVAELGQAIAAYWEQSDLVRGLTIAATEMARASAWAELTTYGKNGVAEVEFSGGSSGDICDEYLGQVYPADDPDTQSIIPIHPRCFPSGVLVSGPRATASSTRWYEGELVVIKTASGIELPVTPNHPVLTPTGWVAAGSLHVGGHVVSGLHAERCPVRIHPDDHQVPSEIAQVANAVGHASRRPATRVPVAAEDFHGDGFGSEVCVVRTERPLRHRCDAALGKPAGHQAFEVAPGSPEALPVAGEVRQQLGRVAVHDSTGALGMGSAGFEAQALHASSSSLAPADRRVARMQQDADKRLADPEGRSQVVLPLTAEVAADKIVDLGRRQFAGLVHSLETTQGWHFANTIVCHNCTHYWSPVIPDEWNLPGVAWAGGDVGDLTNLTKGIDATPEALQQLVASLSGYEEE